MLSSMTRIKTVLSDAGNTLFDDSYDQRDKIETLGTLLAESGRKFSYDDVHQYFRPYRYLAQTVISEEDSVNRFLAYYGSSATFHDYQARKKSPMERQLFEGVTETMEAIRRMGISFYVMTDSAQKGQQLEKSLEEMIIRQLEERGRYNPNFSFNDYVNGIVSSKDVGAKKPAPEFFDFVLRLQKGKPIDRKEALFISHESIEIFGAANLGIPTIAYNYRQENDADDIVRRISSHNKQHADGTVDSKIYKIDSFPQLLDIIVDIV